MIHIYSWGKSLQICRNSTIFYFFLNLNYYIVRWTWKTCHLALHGHVKIKCEIFSLFNRRIWGGGQGSFHNICKKMENKNRGFDIYSDIILIPKSRDFNSTKLSPIKLLAPLHSILVWFEGWLGLFIPYWGGRLTKLWSMNSTKPPVKGDSWNPSFTISLASLKHPY